MTHPLKRLKTFLEGPGGDDFVVVLRTGIEVVVVRRQAGLRKTLGLVIGKHAGRDARFHPQGTHATHHLQHRLEGGTIADFTPSPAHAKPVRTSLLGSFGTL